MTASDLRTLAECYPDDQSRKLIHYRFANRVIPHMAHANPRDFFLHPLLRVNPAQWTRELIGLWQIAAPRAAGTERCGVTDLHAWNEEVRGWPGFFVQMPVPEWYPLAFFVGVVLQPPAPGTTNPTASVFTIERTVDEGTFDTATIGVLGRWFSRDEHGNCGPLKADRAAFVAQIASMVQEPAQPSIAQDLLSAPLGPDGVRGRSDILTLFGIPEREYDLHYIRYLAYLFPRGVTSNWNDEIGEHARQLDALRQSEVTLANTNFHQAIVNRIIVRMVSERKEGMPRLMLPGTQPEASKKKSWWKFW